MSSNFIDNVYEFFDDLPAKRGRERLEACKRQLDAVFIRLVLNEKKGSTEASAFDAKKSRRKTSQTKPHESR